MGSTVTGDVSKLLIPTFDFEQIKEGTLVSFEWC